MYRKVALVFVSFLLLATISGTLLMEKITGITNRRHFRQKAFLSLGEDGSDWWSMFRHDTRHTGYSTSKAPKNNLTLWNYTTEYQVTSSSAVVDGMVFVGSSDKKVYALNATTGAYTWSYTTGDYVHSSPAVANGKVYIGSWDRNVYALDASTGALVWNYTTGGSVDSSPAVTDDRIFLGSRDRKVYALNATTGAYTWSYTTGFFVRSSPSVVDGMVFVGSDDKKVYALNATTGAYTWSYTTGGSVDSSPSVVDGMVFVGSYDKKVYALNATTGAYTWSYTTGDYVHSSPAVADSTVFVGSLDWKIYAFGYHDVAIDNVSLSATEAYAGDTLNIATVVINEGSLDETFEVSVYGGSTLIGTLVVTDLAPEAEKILTFSWGTTDVAGGYYTISAIASTVPRETDTADNTFIDGTAKVISPVRIVEVIPCNQTGGYKNVFELGTMAFFKVTINSTAIIPQDTLITINLYDNASFTIGVASFQGPVLPGTSAIIFGLPTPTSATIGTATAYVSSYTDWPHLGGFPHCLEMSTTIEITEM